MLAFERSYFPAWLPYFRDELEQENYSNVLFAQGEDAAISGTILMRYEAATPWLQEAGKQIGTLNTHGVAPEKQGQGIGLALTAGAMEVEMSSHLPGEMFEKHGLGSKSLKDCNA